MRGWLYILALVAVSLTMPGWTWRLETSYSKAWAAEHQGVAEYRLPDGTRADVVTPELAVEFEYPKHWAESLGQALYYAAQTGRRPAVLYIVGPGDERYVARARRAVAYWQLPVVIETVPR